MPEMAIDESTRSRYLGILGEETSRLERIIGDLLDLARLEGGGGSFMAGACRSPQLFERVQSRQSARARTPACEIAASIEPGAERCMEMPTASSRRFRTSRPTRCATRRAARTIALSARPARGRRGARGHRQRARHRSGAPAAHLRPLLQGRGVANRRTRRREGAVSACRSSKRSSSATAVTSPVASQPGRTVFSFTAAGVAV